MTPERIKWLRYNILHMTQPEFAKIMGTCTASVNRWEKGRSNPVAMARTIMEAIEMAINNYGEARIRGVDWSGILERGGLLKVLYGILSFATTRPMPEDDDESLI